MKTIMIKTPIAIIITIIVVLSFRAGSHYGRKQPLDDQDRRAVLYYSDPMNPGFRSDKPGIAPCGMALEPVYAGAGEGSSLSLPRGAVKIGPERQQLIGVKTAAVEAQPMTYSLRLYGKVVPDETRVYRVNASTDSWIRELSNVTTGSVVRKDQVLAEALAPAYYNAQVTYLIALDNVDRIQQQLGGQLRHQQGDLANNQIRIAVQALQNLGIGDAQVGELADTRQARPYLQVRAPAEGVVLRRNITRNQWFKAAEEFYTIADIRRVWVYADVYENEARHIAPGMAVRVRHAQLGRTFDAKVSEVLPLFDPLSKTLKVRLDVNNPGYELRPDMFVDVEMPITMPPSLNLPADAVIDSGARTIVYVRTGDGVFEPRRVDTGWRLGRRIEITGGVMAGEKVVVSGNFLIDSESRMKTASAGPEVRTGKDPVCGMDVDQEDAESAGRTAETSGKTRYFCSKHCMQVFLEEQEKSAGKKQVMNHEATPEMAGRPKTLKIGQSRERGGSGNRMKTTTAPEVRMSKDPVCGMDVDREKAERAKFAGKAYYFCSKHCFHVFLKEPEKFAGTERPVMNHAGAEKSVKGDQNSEHAVSEPVPAAGDDPGRPARYPGAIDWKGPETEKNDARTRDWKGWGKFPGAEYLGLKNRTKKAPHGRPDTREAGKEKTSQETPDVLSREHGSEMSPDARNGLAPAGKEGPANQ